MSTNEKPSAHARVAITFDHWRRAPVACSKLWVGRRLSDVGGFLSDLGHQLIAEASEELQQSLAAGELGRAPLPEELPGVSASGSFSLKPNDRLLRDDCERYVEAISYPAKALRNATEEGR
jgi:hypothetical protein